MQVTTTDVMNSVRNNRDKDRSPSSMLLFGFGDGGGGPNTEMLEKIRRLAGAATRGGGSEGGGGAAGELPALTIGGPTEFFQDLEANARDLLTW